MKKYFFFIITLSLFACKAEKNENPIEKTDKPENLIRISEDQAELAGIETAFLEKKTFSKILTCSGNIEPTPNGYAMLTPPMGGFVKELNHYIGKKISKNDILVKLENPDFINLQEEYLIAESQLEFLENEYLRKKSLFEDKAVSEKDFLKAKSEYLKINAVFRAASSKLKMLNINPKSINNSELSSQIVLYSPIDGYIAKINGNVGKFFSETDVIIEIVNPENLHLHLKIFEKDISLIKNEQIVEFASLSEPHKKYNAKVFSLGHSIDKDDFTVTVHASIANKDENLIPGLFVNASIRIKEEEVYAIPFEGLVIGENNNYIFLETNEGYIKKEVITGPEQDGFMSIIDAKENIINSKVVVNGAYFINAALEASEEE